MFLHFSRTASVLLLLACFLVHTPDACAVSEAGNGSGAGGTPPVLVPKLQKELGKALEALQTNNPAQARGHLDVAFRLAPDDPNVNFLFGTYSEEINDWAVAKSYWQHALSVSPDHLNALLALGYALLREGKPAEAVFYLSRAAEVEPTCWRAHALLAYARFRGGSPTEAIRQAERALELGHGQAEVIQPLLAQALHLQGETQEGVLVLQDYLRDHAEDAFARKQLEYLRAILDGSAAGSPPAEGATALPAEELSARLLLPLPSNWLPPGVDEKVPPVESGASCDLNEIIRMSGKRTEEFVANVDRFTATETVTHESIDKWGLASHKARLAFDYVVSIQEVRRGWLSVSEYRGHGDSLTKFPDGIASVGLSALVLIFHPYNAGNFAMTCEGLTHWNGAPAWQVYFRQRPDKPNTIRIYKIGISGPAYPVALKGRAWIAADTYQILRLETDIIAPLPEIRLAADRMAIEYGPVHFQTRKLDMWLPQNAEVYYDWRGHRTHRRHSFSNYLLFSVEDKQNISAPPTPPAAPAGPGAGG
jgi:Tfp pilus assembly protein PilF